jgi:hypothetical protein
MAFAVGKLLVCGERCAILLYHDEAATNGWPTVVYSWAEYTKRATVSILARSVSEGDPASGGCPPAEGQGPARRPR